jgi:hypothetical protein
MMTIQTSQGGVALLDPIATQCTILVSDQDTPVILTADHHILQRVCLPTDRTPTHLILVIQDGLVLQIMDHILGTIIAQVLILTIVPITLCGQPMIFRRITHPTHTICTETCTTLVCLMIMVIPASDLALRPTLTRATHTDTHLSMANIRRTMEWELSRPTPWQNSTLWANTRTRTLHMNQELPTAGRDLAQQATPPCQATPLVVLCAMN